MSLLSRVEDASLNASAPPQQRWLDGWILRYSPGKARRARCVNAVAAGRLPLAQKLELTGALFREAGLPMVLRITPFTLPPTLDEDLATLGWPKLDVTRVLVLPRLSNTEPTALVPGTHWARRDAAEYAEEVGKLRGSPEAHRLAHAQRLTHSPVPYCGYAIRRDSDELVLACGQYAREGDLVGFYDVYTRESDRRLGLARRLCERLLSLAAIEGAEAAYLQVEAGNDPALRVYQRLGFVGGYSYHYREAPENAA